MTFFEQSLVDMQDELYHLAFTSHATSHKEPLTAADRLLLKLAMMLISRLDTPYQRVAIQILASYRQIKGLDTYPEDASALKP